MADELYDWGDASLSRSSSSSKRKHENSQKQSAHSAGPRKRLATSKATHDTLSLSTYDSAVELASSPASTTSAAPSLSSKEPAAAELKSKRPPTKSPANSSAQWPSSDPKLLDYYTGHCRLDLSDEILRQPEFLYFLMHTYELHALSISHQRSDEVYQDALIQSCHQDRVEQAMAFVTSVSDVSRAPSLVSLTTSASLLSQASPSSATILSLSDLEKELTHFECIYATYTMQMNYAPCLAPTTDAFLSDLLEEVPTLETCFYLKNARMMILGGPKRAIFEVIRYVNSIQSKSRSKQRFFHSYQPFAMQSSVSTQRPGRYYQYRLPLETLVSDWLIRHWQDASHWLQIRFGLADVVHQRGEIRFCGERGVIEAALRMFADVVENCIAFKIDARWKDGLAEYVDWIAGSINSLRALEVRKPALVASIPTSQDAEMSAGGGSHPSKQRSCHHLALFSNTVYRYVYPVTIQQLDYLKVKYDSTYMRPLKQACNLTHIQSWIGPGPAAVRLEGTKDSILAALSILPVTLQQGPTSGQKPHRFDEKQLSVLLPACNLLDDSTKMEWNVDPAPAALPTGPKQRSNSAYRSTPASSNIPTLGSNVSSLAIKPLSVKAHSGDPFASIVTRAPVLASKEAVLEAECRQKARDDPHMWPETVVEKPEEGPLQLRHSLKRLKFRLNNKSTKRQPSPDKSKSGKPPASKLNDESEAVQEGKRVTRTTASRQAEIKIEANTLATSAVRSDPVLEEEVSASETDSEVLASRESSPLSDPESKDSEEEDEPDSEYDAPVEELKASSSIENNILSNVVDHAFESSENCVKSQSDAYKPYFQGTGNDLITVEYPAWHEPYLLHTHKRKKDADEYNPVEEVMSVVQLVLDHFMVEEDAALFESSKGEPLLDALEKAYRLQDKSAFLKHMAQYNALLASMKVNGKIDQHLKCRALIPQDVALFITEQAYQRIVSPKTHILRRYLAFSDNVYGELLPSLLLSMFKATNLSREHTFVDLGSGVGNAVILAALATGCDSHGYENMAETHQIAADHVDEVNARCSLFGLAAGQMQAHCADFTKDPKAARLLAKADVVLANNFLFGPETTEKLVNLFLDMKDGAFIISLKPFIATRTGARARSSDHGRARVQDYILEQVAVKTYPRNSVSWSGQGGVWYLSRIKNRTTPV